MIKRMMIAAATFSLAACAGGHSNVDIDALSEARAAVAASKDAGAERCAPKLQAQAVASLYWAAHEIQEGGHATEEAELTARAIAKANAARTQAKVNCAPKAAPIVVEIIKLSGVNFANNSADLTAESIAILDGAVATLKRRADIRVEVAAHTSSRGAAAYNLSLSNSRAASVMDYLVSHGIAADRLTSKGYGETQLIADESTRAGEAQNRRVELRVMN